MGKNVFDIPAAQSWIRRWVDTLIYGKYSQTIQNVSTDRPIFFCKVKPHTSTIINLKVSGPSFQGSINLAVTIGDKAELSKAAMSVLATSIPAFFSGSTVYLATSVDSLLEDFVFIGFSVPATGTFTIGMQAVSSERNGIVTCAYSVPMATVPNVRFKVSDGYLAGYPTIKPIRELDAFRQWSAVYKYVAEDPVFFHGSAYFANPAMVPEVGESPVSAPAKWIQLARPDPGPMDITEGARTPQVFYQPGLILSNSTALVLRKNYQDQGMKYPSNSSKVYHFDDDLFDQDQLNPLVISIKYPEPEWNDVAGSEFAFNDISVLFPFNDVDVDNIVPHFVNEDSDPEPSIASTPAITKKPFKEVPSFYYGTYAVKVTIPDNSGDNVLDYWFKILESGGFVLVRIEMVTGEIIQLLMGYEEPFWNDNTGVALPNNFPFNVNVTMPGTVVYNERDTDGDLVLLQNFGMHRARSDFTIGSPQIGVWNHLSINISNNKIKFFLNGEQEEFTRLSTGFGGDSSVILNPTKIPIGLDELLIDSTTSISFDRFNQVSGRGLPWAYHEWDDGWLTIFGNDPDKIDSNLALFIFPKGSVITQSSENGLYDDNHLPWVRFHNFKEDQFILQGEVAPSGGNGEKTRFWQRIS